MAEAADAVLAAAGSDVNEELVAETVQAVVARLQRQHKAQLPALSTKCVDKLLEGNSKAAAARDSLEMQHS